LAGGIRVGFDLSIRARARGNIRFTDRKTSHMIPHLWFGLATDAKWPKTKTCMALFVFIASAFIVLDSPSTSVAQEKTIERFREIDALVQTGISEGKMPGCVICIGTANETLFLKAYGSKRLEPSVQPMTTDTVFDMASITKPVATATSIMQLIEHGKLSLSDKVATVFPAFASNDKDTITVQDLLLHRSGLIPDNALADYQDGPEKAWDRICQLKLVAPVGTAFKYSDVNFIVLGKLVEHFSGKTLHEYTQEAIFRPLGMNQSGFLPSAELAAKCAPTEQRDGHWMQGEVHDPRAHLLGGIAGHAGLFSTAEDIAIYAKTILKQGGSILSPRAVAAMTTAYPVPSGLRGLGWDKRTSFSINRGDLLSPSAFGHGGFTGNVLWIDPEMDLFYVFLSNRVHPNGKGLVNPLAGKIANVAAAAVRQTKPAPRAPRPPVLTGLDVLERNGFRELAGQRVGLITNHTGRNQSGQSAVRLFQNAPNVKLNVLFSPEHGFEGKLDIAKVADSEDKNSGLKIYSLYGETRRPTAEMLSQLDIVVFDIQDIGTRFYTYISTMGEAMIAAAEHHRKFIVLDRPNPINGTRVVGPMLDPKSESFVGFYRLPVRHGMTIGELARMFKGELKLDLDLQVIACEGWERADYWDATGLTWVNPSPNMRSLTQALLYPGIGLIETTNVSVGRGTDTPFEVVGAPWMDGRELASQLNEKQMPGVKFVPIEFTPTSTKFPNEACKGINIIITDRQAIEPVRVGLTLAATLRRLYPTEWETKSLNRLLSNQAALALLLEGLDGDSLEPAIVDGVSEFLRKREEYVLYR
jgi:uncharacterized protein YbbC (DUF1343 family)